MTEKFNAVKCDYNNEEGFWCVDAWKTSNPNEGGRIVAFIHEKTGQVAYADPDARLSPRAQEVIRAKVAEIVNAVPAPYEAVPSLDRLYASVREHIRQHQGEKGFISTQNPALNPIACFVWMDGQNVEYKIHGLRVKNDNIEIVFDCDNVGAARIEYNVESFNAPDADWRILQKGGDLMYVQTLFNLAMNIEEHTGHDAAEPGLSVSVSIAKASIVSNFMFELRKLWENRWFDIMFKHPALENALAHFSKDNPWWETLEASRILYEEIIPALSECSSEGYTFGVKNNHYGFWPKNNA